VGEKEQGRRKEAPTPSSKRCAERLWSQGRKEKKKNVTQKDVPAAKQEPTRNKLIRPGGDRRKKWGIPKLRPVDTTQNELGGFQKIFGDNAGPKYTMLTRGQW